MDKDIKKLLEDINKHKVLVKYNDGCITTRVEDIDLENILEGSGFCLGINKNNIISIYDLCDEDDEGNPVEDCELGTDKKEILEELNSYNEYFNDTYEEGLNEYQEEYWISDFLWYYTGE